MTRDTQRLHDGRDLVDDAEVYTALWAASGPFPRLPEDAPTELKNATIDLDDPKRVYAIHRASRRHYFHVLVERYIVQIRYGCQSKTCNTTTCFSSRQRVAGGVPVRRYNATSARSLAVYMASQDNPEHGLCHHPSVGRPSPQIIKSSKAPSHSTGKKSVFLEQDSSRIQGSQGGPARTITAHTSEAKTQRGNEIDPQDMRQRSLERDDLLKATRPDLTTLDEPTTTDHRSFVQNVFGTAAFRIIEWLTPRNFEITAGTDESSRLRHENKRGSGYTAHVSTTAGPAKYDRKEQVAPGLETRAVSTQQTWSDVPEIESETTTRKSAIPGRKLTSAEDKDISSPDDAKSSSVPATQTIPASHIWKKPEPIDVPSPKGILNVAAPKTSENHNEVGSLSQMNYLPSKPKRKLSRQALIANPKLPLAETISTTKQPRSIASTPATECKPKIVQEKEEERKTKRSPSMSTTFTEVTGKETSIPVFDMKPEVSPPQSLSILSIEMIDLLCNILQSDNTIEKHDLEPQVVPEELRRSRDGSVSLCRNQWLRASSPYSSNLKIQWHAFIEQSLFDVLGRPESLLRSFRNENKMLLDTQTLWYLMLRLTRVAPSLVFNSLWSVTGTLFKPPEKLEAACDWMKEFFDQNALVSKPVSNSDAAQLISICLHALIAAAPLVSDARQLANMSRVRSYGISMLWREYAASLEPANISLQYDDAFTNEPALRLARRLFASIPTRRRFSDLLELQTDGRKGEIYEQDVLENVLDSFKFLDLGTAPILNFSEEERSLHEKRAPTLILDWARTVMLQDWKGAGEVPKEGSFGGALAMVASIYKNRKSLILGDIHFRTEYFSERLDSVGMPLEWMAFEPNRRTVHLLDHPYLFNPATLVTYFRSINYSRMNQSYESAKATSGLMHLIMTENSLITDKQRRDKLYGSLRLATSRFLVLEIRRDSILVDTFNAIWRREERELMRPLKIRLGENGGEEGLDSGGVQQEFFRLAIAEAINPDYGTFTIDTRTKMTWFLPGSPEPLWKFELIGTIMSLAIYNGLTLPITFPKAFYRKLLDEDVTELHHIADGWPELANGLTTLLEWDEKDGLVEDIFARTYEFSVEQFGNPVSRDMGTSISWPQYSESQPISNPDDAPMVTNENRNSYVSDYIRWLTDVSVRPQFEAFKAGFFTCIDRRSVTLFDSETLQSVVEGVQEIDISELRRAARYIGWDASSRTVRDFWSIVKRFDIEHKRKLLEFVTASDRVPVGGMRNLQFTMQRNGVEDGHLPTSYTCYGILLLPDYSSKEVLREKLEMALENSMGFGFA